jgi:subtilisin family serine protease
MILTFAAGNCGSKCPANGCDSDVGPGKSIWGASGHPKVTTVGAANILEEWIGSTSQGPAALDPKKPDFCAPSHFKGYTDCDNGTSAANSVCAGVIGLLKSYDPTLTQDIIKDALQKTARNLCDSGWDPHSGYGMIQAEAAFNKIAGSSVSVAHAR